MCLSIPGKLIHIEEQTDRPTAAKPDDELLWRTGKVSFAGAVKAVSLAYVPEAKVGDYVIVHVGFAISVLDPEAAEQSLSYFDQLQLNLN